MDRTEANALTTLDYYEHNADAFSKNTASADMLAILRSFVSMLPEGATVLDWGCGTGRDSRSMLDMGLSVVSTDASPAMCQIAKELFDVEVVCERFDELKEESEYDGIWACASLLHVRKSELPAMLCKAHKALKPQGVLYTSFKYGIFEGMRKGRWFTDLDEGALAELVGNDFEIVKMWTTSDVRPGRAEERWLNSLLQKRS